MKLNLIRKKYILFSLLIFLFAVLVGIVFYYIDQTGAAIVINRESALDNIPVDTSTNLGSLFFIFLNNIVVTFVTDLIGGFFFLPAIASLFSSGLDLGIILSNGALNGGFWFSLLLIIPHGIIETAVMIVSTSIGFRLGKNLYHYLKYGVPLNKKMLVSGLKFFLFYLVPLLLFAAIIEVYASTPIFQYIYKLLYGEY